MRISIELSEEQSDRLKSLAESLGIQPDELARATFLDLLAKPQDDFQKAAEEVLRKNKQLYERLA